MKLSANPSEERRWGIGQMPLGTSHLVQEFKQKRLTVRQSEMGTLIKYKRDSLRTLVLDFRREKEEGHWNR